MTAHRLLAHFDAVVDTPGAVQRLRRFILDLAVRGKLVPQDPNDEPASELLRRTAAENARLVKAKRIKNTKPEIGHDHSDLRGWSIASVGSLLVLRYGKGMIARERLEKGPVPVYGSNGIVGYCEKPLTDMPAIIIGRKGSAGALNLCDGPSWTTDVAYYVEAPDPFDLRYLFIGLQTLDLGSLGKGVKPGLSRNEVYELSLGVPPLAEQSRIVARVDELMALCDRLDAAIAKRKATRDRFAVASLARLSAPEPDPVTVRAHADFVIDNFDRLTTRSDQIKTLRRTILNLAVRGALVAQNPNDEPASELLKCINEENNRLVEAREIRRQKPLRELSREEIPFTLPANWAWSQVAEIGVLSPRNSAPDDVQVSFVPMSMIASEYGVPHRHEIRRWAEIRSGYTHFAEGDVGVAKITPCFENGKSTVFRNLAGGLGSGTTELHIIRPLFVDPKYVVLFFKCPYFIETGIPKMTGTAGQKRMPAEHFANSPFPLPPLAEQHRIVARVDELMALCDRLEEHLVTTEDAGGRLLRAMLHETLSNPPGASPPHREERRSA